MKVKTGATRGRRGLNPVSGEVRSAILAVEASHYFNLQYGGLHDVRVSECFAAVSGCATRHPSG